MVLESKVTYSLVTYFLKPHAYIADPLIQTMGTLYFENSLIKEELLEAWWFHYITHI